MAIDFITIAMIYKLEAMQEDNPFTTAQRNELVRIMDKVELLKITQNPVKAVQTIQKYKKLEGEYLKKFNSWNGNGDRLNASLRAYENSNMPLINEFKEKFKELKKRFNLK